MNDCLFCKIVRQEIPSHRVFENEHVYAFLDINPVHLGHTLVVPKKHFAGFLDCDNETLLEWIRSTQKIANAMMGALGIKGFNLAQNEGAIAGQLVAHLHMHVIPRHENDGLHHWPHSSYASQEEAKGIALKIFSHIDLTE